jgi:putative glycosyltransferase (TIGR04372 family)
MQVAVSGELISNKQAQELLSKVRKPIIFLTIRDIRYDQKIRMHTKGMHARYRNSSIGNYEPAIRYLIESGYFVVRGGEAGENCGFTLATDFLDLTDAKFDLFRDEMQFVLASRSSFFIGSDTGAIHLATLFRKPFFRVNISSSLSMGRGSVYEKLSLFREFVDRESGKLLNFEQIAKRGLLTCSHDDDFEKVGVVSIENTAEHILDFTQECVQYFLGNWTPNANSVTLSRYYDEICFKYGFEKQGVKFSNNWSNQYASLINQSIVT